MPREPEAPAGGRLFVALELPAAVRGALATWADRVVAGVGRALRPVAKENLHLTLCFLGQQPLGEASAIAAACEAAMTPRVLQLALEAAIWLPPRRPRVLAVRLVDVAGALGPVQAGLSDALAAGGWYEPEQRAYLPHVTVARVRGDARLRSVDLPPLPDLEPFSGVAVALLRSHLGRGGARYEPVWKMFVG